MKSVLFRKNDATRDDAFQREPFKKDFQVLLGLSDGQLQQLPAMMKAIIPIKNQKEKDKARDEGAKQLGLSVADFAHAYSVAGFFAQEFLPDGDAENDSPADIAQDLVELTFCPPEAVSRITDLLTRLRDVIQKDLDTYVLSERALRKGCVRLTQASSSIEFRAVFKDEADFGDPSEGYSPKCIGFAPVVTLHLSLTGGDRDEFAFECDTDKLKMLHHTIEQAVEELRVAKEALHLENRK